MQGVLFLGDLDLIGFTVCSIYWSQVCCMWAICNKKFNGVRNERNAYISQGVLNAAQGDHRHQFPSNGIATFQWEKNPINFKHMNSVSFTDPTAVE